MMNNQRQIYMNGNGHARNLDISDISGAQPRKLFSNDAIGTAALNILGQGVPAGYNRKVNVHKPGMVSDIWCLGNKGEESPKSRNPLETHDINGPKVNIYG